MGRARLRGLVFAIGALAAAGGAAGCARSMAFEGTQGSLDAVRERNPKLVDRAVADLEADPTARGIGERVTAGVLDATEARLSDRARVAKAEAAAIDFTRRLGALLADDVEARVRRVAKEAAQAATRAATETAALAAASLEKAVEGAVASLDRAVSGWIDRAPPLERLPEVAARTGSAFGKAIAAEVAAELMPAVSATAQALLVTLTPTAHAIARAVTAGIWEENEAQLRRAGWSRMQIAGAVAGAAALIAVGAWIGALRRELRTMRAALAAMERGGGRGPGG